MRDARCSTIDRGLGCIRQTKDDSPIIAVSPGSLNFAPVLVGTNADLVLTVQNVGGTKLLGAPKVASPFTIVRAVHYSLKAAKAPKCWCGIRHRRQARTAKL